MTSDLTPKTFGISYESISFYTKDNILLRAWFIPSTSTTTKTIVLLHGYPADKGDILPSRLFLHPFYNLLLFDFRYFGKSGGLYSSVGKNEVNDLLAAIQYLQSRNIYAVGVWGLSMGGAVALMAATQTNAIKAIVAESSYARLDWLANDYYRIPVFSYPLAKLTQLWANLIVNINVKQVSPVKSAEQLNIPILIIHSKQDQVIPFLHAQTLQKALAHHANAEFLFMEKGAHGELTPQEQNRIKQFFKLHVGR
jgi:dipeptidyl aminopeptidase/acylaminoacyl peptidase